jgi:predicted site-specific integrase-resolvase
MKLAAWAECNGVAWVTACRWFRAGLVPVPTQRVGRLVLVDEPTGKAGVWPHWGRDPAVTRLVVEHRGRFCWFGSEDVRAALAAQGWELVVVDSSEIEDDLVRGMTEILTGVCARAYCERAAANLAEHGVTAATTEGAVA